MNGQINQQGLQNRDVIEPVPEEGQQPNLDSIQTTCISGANPQVVIENAFAG